MIFRLDLDYTFVYANVLFCFSSSMLCEKARIALGVELSDCQCERLKKRLKIIKQNMHLVSVSLKSFYNVLIHP